MKIKNNKKYICYLIIAVVGSYVLAVIASAIMMNQMTKITYNAMAFGKVIRKDIIDFNANTAQRDYYGFDGEPKEHNENLINNTTEIKIACIFSLFPLWRKNYNNPGVMDGDQYNIVRSYQNGESITYGSNAYPLTYLFVIMAIENAIK